MYIKGDSKAHKILIPILNLVSVKFKLLSLFYLKIKSCRQKKYPRAFIVSVDNLAFGGTGKTTLVLEIGEALEREKIKFAAVTRGYRSRFEKRGTLVAAGQGADEVGDEAQLLKNRFPGQDIFVGKDRRRSIREAIQRKNRVILLDDGFQSTDIYKDVKVMLYNPGHPYYYLRNFKFLLEEADFTLFYRRHLPGKAPRREPGNPAGWFGFETGYFYDRENRGIDPGKSPLVGFAAVGDNARFEADLREFNCAAFRGYRDHFFYTQGDIEALEKLRKKHRARYLVCTEKDFVKLIGLDLKDIPLIYARNRIQFTFDLIGEILDHAKEKGFI